jgi:hypothetical protein
MKTITFAMVLACVLLGCGGSGPMVGTTGTGGSSTTTAPTTGGAGGMGGGAGGTGGSLPAPVTLDAPSCKPGTPLGPIEPSDGIQVNGVTLDETGAVVARCWPISEPIAIDTVSYLYGGKGGCAQLDHDVVLFHGATLPAGAPVSFPIVRVPVSASSLTWDSASNTANVQVDVSSAAMAVAAGEYLCAGIDLRNSAEGRGCIGACTGQPKEAPDLDVYSADGADGKPVCGAASCSLIALDQSPTPALAASFGLASWRVSVGVAGHTL